jgi:hypothetical protein
MKFLENDKLLPPIGNLKYLRPKVFQKGHVLEKVLFLKSSGEHRKLKSLPLRKTLNFD